MGSLEGALPSLIGLGGAHMGLCFVRFEISASPLEKSDVCVRVCVWWGVVGLGKNKSGFG